MNGDETSGPREKKLEFLALELQDIRNNKGNVTLQVRSIEHLQTWLKRDKKLSSELLIKPLEVRAEQIKQALDLPASAQWWKSSTKDQVDEEPADTFSKPIDFKSESKVATEISKVAKKHHMTTDVKKAVFQAIIGSEDYL